VRKIVEYLILTEVDNEKLEVEIEKALRRGLQPYGYLIVTGQVPHTNFYQAMVKCEEEKL
jgi:hypothetical protein